MITDSLLAELKIYLKEHYKLVSFTGIFPGKKTTGQQSISTSDASCHPKSFSEVTDLMSDFLKEKRDYDTFAFALEKIRKEKGLSPADLYKAAWINKRLYSKIMTTDKYRPAKNTAIAFGLALKLKPDEFADFLQNAGFALSESSIFDLVIRFCVEREIFDLHDVNSLLFQADQKTLAREAS